MLTALARLRCSQLLPASASRLGSLEPVVPFEVGAVPQRLPPEKRHVDTRALQPLPSAHSAVSQKAQVAGRGAGLPPSRSRLAGSVIPRKRVTGGAPSEPKAPARDWLGPAAWRSGRRCSWRRVAWPEAQQLYFSRLWRWASLARAVTRSLGWSSRRRGRGPRAPVPASGTPTGISTRLTLALLRACAAKGLGPGAGLRRGLRGRGATRD